MKILISALLALFICSCGEKNENRTEKTADTIQDTATTKTDTNIVAKDSISYSSLSFEEKREAFKTLCNSEYDEIGKKEKGIRTLELGNPTFNSSLFMKKKTTVKYGDVEGIYPVIKLFIYEYNSENECNAAYKRWLECFESECDKLTEGTDMKAIKMPPMYFIKNNGSIIVLKYLCEHNENDWTNVKAKLDKVFREENAVVCEIGCGGPLVWLK